MKPFPVIGTVSAMFLTIILLDYIWLGIISKNFIIDQFRSLVKVENGSIVINLGVGLLTWLIIAIGVFVFAVHPATSLTHAMTLGAALGFLMYAVYDLTNLTFLQNYPVKFAVVDIVWGTFLCSILSLVGFLIRRIL